MVSPRFNLESPAVPYDALRRPFIDGCEAMKSIHVDISVPSHPAHGDLFQRLGPDPMDY